MDDNLPDVMPDEDTPELQTLPEPNYSHPWLSKYSPEAFLTICENLRDGISLTKSCKEQGVDKASFYRWAEISQTHSHLYSLAREKAGDAWFDKVQHLVEQLTTMDMSDYAKTPAIANAQVNALDKAARLALEVAKRYRPDVYGDRLETINRNLSISYVVSFGSQGQEQPTVIDIPVLDITPQSRPNHDKQGSKSGSKAKTRASVQAKPNKGGKVGRTKKKGAE